MNASSTPSRSVESDPPSRERAPDRTGRSSWVLTGNPLTYEPPRNRITASLTLLAWVIVGYEIARFSPLPNWSDAADDLGLLSSTFVALWMTPEVWPSSSPRAVVGFRVSAVFVPAIAAIIALVG